VVNAVQPPAKSGSAPRLAAGFHMTATRNLVGNLKLSPLDRPAVEFLLLIVQFLLPVKEIDLCLQLLVGKRFPLLVCEDDSRSTGFSSFVSGIFACSSQFIFLVLPRLRWNVQGKTSN